MADKNEVHLSGVLADDAEVMTSKNGNSYCRFRLRVEHEKGKAYYPLVIFGDESEKLDGIAGGTIIRVVGRLARSEYEERWQTDIIATRIGIGASAQGEIPKAQQPKDEAPAQEEVSDDDDIPF
jgi:single-stranded DNA-binding protein